jgi:hypothetical protein
MEGLWYTVWVWGGAYAYNNGSTAVTYSSADALLNVSVPWFSWQNG